MPPFMHDEEQKKVRIRFGKGSNHGQTKLYFSHVFPPCTHQEKGQPQQLAPGEDLLCGQHPTSQSEAIGVEAPGGAQPLSPSSSAPFRQMRTVS